MHATPPFPPALWEHTPVAVYASLRPLAARVAALEATGQRVLERLQQAARTSSRLPSRAPPHAVGQRPRRVPSGRTRGGHPGHPGQTRVLVPIEDGDPGVPVTPPPGPRGHPPVPGADPQP